MKSFLLLTAFALVCDSVASAQTSPQVPLEQRQVYLSHSTQSSSSGDHNAGARKMKGCIETVNGKYVLKDKSGKRKVLVGEQDFASHVGHLVLVNGNSGSSGSANGTPFSVSKLELVSDRCSLNPGTTEQANNSKPSPYHHK